MAARPNLNDPTELSAYRKELRGVARRWRYSGIALAVIGAGLMLARAKHVVALPILIPIVIIIAAIVAMSIAILTRSLHHARRMRLG